jgi:hypothetical protein
MLIKIGKSVINVEDVVFAGIVLPSLPTLPTKIQVKLRSGDTIEIATDRAEEDIERLASASHRRD